MEEFNQTINAELFDNDLEIQPPKQIKSLAFIDIDNFIDNYGDVFNGGVYNNLKTGFIDICGINYYKSELIESFINLIKSKSLPEYEKIVLWLEEALQHNGFYILGI